MLRLIRFIVPVVLAVAAAAPRDAGAQQGADPLLNRYYGLKAANPAAARAVLEQAARQYPRDIRVQLELGYLTLAAGEKPRALAAFRIAVQLAPGRADLWRQIGYVENDLANYPAALAAFEESRRRDPGNDAVTLQIRDL